MAANIYENAALADLAGFAFRLSVASQALHGAHLVERHDEGRIACGYFVSTILEEQRGVFGLKSPSSGATLVR